MLSFLGLRDGSKSSLFLNGNFYCTKETWFHLFYLIASKYKASEPVRKKSHSILYLLISARMQPFYSWNQWCRSYSSIYIGWQKRGLLIIAGRIADITSILCQYLNTAYMFMRKCLAGDAIKIISRNYFSSSLCITYLQNLAILALHNLQSLSALNNFFYFCPCPDIHSHKLVK